MADGTTASNGIGESSADNGQGMVVGQVRAPSTPFASDMDPLSEFQFSGREDVVTVRDVEEIVTAVRESFARFIETQRSYLDRSSALQQSSSEEKSSKDTLLQTEDAVSQSNESGLTEPVDSDIIQTVSEEEPSLSRSAESELSELNALPSGESELQNDISEKLLQSEKTVGEKGSAAENPTESEKGIVMSFVDFMTESFSNIKDGVSKIQSSIFGEREEPTTYVSETANSVDTDESGTTLESVVEKVSPEVTPAVTETAIEDVAGKGDEDNELFSKVGSLVTGAFDGISSMFSGSEDKYVESEKERHQEGLKDNQASFADVVAETNEIAKGLVVDVGNVAEQVTGLSNGGIAKSMVEMMLQDSSLEMMLSGSVEKMGSATAEAVESRFGEVIGRLRSIESDEAALHPSMPEPSSDSDSEANAPQGDETVSSTSVVETMAAPVESAVAVETETTVVQPPTVTTSGGTEEMGGSKSEEVEEKASIGDTIANSFGKMTSFFSGLFGRTEKTTRVEVSEDEKEDEYEDEYPYVDVDVDEAETAVTPLTPNVGEEGSDETTAEMPPMDSEYVFDDIADAFSEQTTAIAESEPLAEETPDTLTPDNGLDTQPAVTADMSEKVMASPDETAAATSGAGGDSLIESIKSAIESNRKYNGGRFDKLEEMISGVSGTSAVGRPDGGGSGGVTVVERSIGDTFEVERIH